MGTVSVKRAMLKATNVKQCLAIEAPAFVAFYRAAQNFAGADTFELEVTFAGAQATASFSGERGQTAAEAFSDHDPI